MSETASQGAGASIVGPAAICIASGELLAIHVQHEPATPECP